MLNPEPSFNVLLCGDRNVGKTAFARRCESGAVADRYQPTRRPSTHRMSINTTGGPISFILWDVPGEVSSVESYVGNVDAALLMFDLQVPKTLDSVPVWYERLTMQKKLPVVLCGNKVDLPYRRLGPVSITFHRENHLRYADISAKVGLGITKPLLWLAHLLLADPHLELVQQPVPATTATPPPPPHKPPKSPDVQRAGPVPSYGDPAESNPVKPTPQTTVRHRLQQMLSTLQQHPDIVITESKIGPPTPPNQILQAKLHANGTLPAGVEEFYSQVGSVHIEWTYTNPKTPTSTTDLPTTGCIHILPITEVFGDNWRDITWFPLPGGVEACPDDEWRFTYRKVVPFDFFVPEACMCFIQEDGATPQDYVAFHYFGETLCNTRYTFAEYIERLLASYGFWYWGETLCEESQESAQVLAFRENMPIIFKGSNDELFRP